MNRSIPYLCCAFLAGLVLPCSAQTPPAASAIQRYEQMLLKNPAEGTAFDKVFQHYQMGEGLEKLEAYWDAQAAADPANAAAYWQLRGILAERRNDVTAAGDYFKKAAEADPANFRPLVSLGNLGLRNGKTDEAIASYEKALKCDPPKQEKAELLRRLGQAYQRKLDSVAALNVWKRMVEEFPEDTFALTEAGNALLEADQFDEARTVFEKLAAQTEEGTPARIQVRIQLGEVEDRRGNKEKAVVQYEQLLDDVSETSWLNREIRSRIEQVYRRQDDLPSLAKFYAKRLEGKPTDVESALRYSRVLEELNKKPESLEWLKKAAALAPDRKPVQLELARALAVAKDFDGAEKILRDLAARDTANTRYWELIADVLLARRTPASAEDRAAGLETLRKLVVDQKNANQLLQLAAALQARDYREEAVQEYHKALVLTPEAVDARLQCVELLVKLNRQEEAWKLLEKMVAGELATAANYNRLSATWQKYAEKERAYAAIEAGLQLDPKYFELLWSKSRLLAEDKKWDEVLALNDRLLDAAPNAYFAEQIEGRYPAMLSSAEKFDSTYSALTERLGGSPALTEREMRLLARLQVHKGDQEGFAKLMEEAHKLYPNSESLLRLELAQLRRQGDLEQAVKLVEKLIGLVPQQKAELLGEIARIRRDQMMIEPALAAAQQVIDASPAGADGYLLYAEIASSMDRSEDAIAKLRDAVKLSDRPNDIRNKLVQLYRDAGNFQKATETCEEAFEAAESPQDKLALVRQLTEAYFQQDRLAELIERFRSRQRAEEGGWRYGMYLAELFQHLQDFGSARRELALSLASRPEDAGLLKQLVRIASREGDLMEQIRYQELLVQQDQAVDEQIALARLYASLTRYADAMQVIQRNAVAFQKDPMAWGDVLAELSGSEFAPQVRQLLTEAAKGDDVLRLMALAEFQIATQDFAGAQANLWKVFALPVPPEPPAKQPAAMSSRMRIWYGAASPDYMRRLSRTYAFRQRVQGLIERSGARRTYSSYSSNAVQTPAGAAEAHDKALAYLSQLAIRENAPDPFLTRLEEEMNRQAASHLERILIYSLCEAGPALLDELTKVTAMEAPDRELLGTATVAFFQVESNIIARGGDKSAVTKLADDLRAKVTKVDPELGAMMVIFSSLSSAGQSTPPPEKRKEILELIAKTTDANDPDEITLSLFVATVLKDWPAIDRYLGLLEKSDLTKLSTLMMDLTWLPQQLLTNNRTGEPASDVDPVKFAELTIRCLKLVTPKKVKPAGLPSANPQSGMVVGNRYLIGAQQYVLDQINRSQPTLLPGLIQGLDKWEQTAEGLERNHPRMTKMRLHQLAADNAKAIEQMKLIVQDDPADDMKLILASLYNDDGKPGEAMKLVESLKARFGPAYADAQRELLRTAKLNKDLETAKKAALRLTSFQMTDAQRESLVSNLEELGLKDNADSVKKRAVTSRSSGPSSGEQALMQSMQDAIGKKDNVKAVELARQILRRPATGDNDEYLRGLAVQALKTAGELDKMIETVKAELQQSPDSPLLNYNLGTLIAGKSGPVFVHPPLPTPFWLRLKREGNQFIATYSRDGETWREMEPKNQELKLNAKLYAGVIASSHDPNFKMHAKVDQISIKRPDGTSVDGPWSNSEIGTPHQPSTFKEENGVLSLETDGGDLWNEKDIAHFAWKEVEGDAEITVRVSEFESDHEFGKVGIVFRESLEPGARHLSTLALKRRGITTQRRVEPDQKTASTTSYGTFEVPMWLQLERKGGQVIARASKDGEAWVDVQTLDFPPEDPIRIGFMAWQNGTDSKMTATWEEVKFPENAGPWTQKDQQKAKSPATFTLEDKKMTVVGPSPDSSGHARAWYDRELQGDGMISARITEFSSTDKPNSFIGLSIRKANAENNLPLFTISPRTGTNLAVRSEYDYANTALEYFKKAAMLNPTPAAKKKMLSQLIRTNKPAAVEMVLELLKSDGADVLESHGYNLVELFADSARLPELVAGLEAIEPKPNPQGNYNTEYRLHDIAESLFRHDKFEDALKVVRKALTWPPSYYTGRNRAMEVAILIRLGKLDEAKSVVLAAVNGVEPPKQAQSKLGFNNAFSTQNTLFSTSSYTGGETNCAFLDLALFALELGIADDLTARLQDESNPLSKEDREIGLALISILRRDAKLKERVTPLVDLIKNGQRPGYKDLLIQELAKAKEKDLVAMALQNSAAVPGDFSDPYFGELLDDDTVLAAVLPKYTAVWISTAKGAQNRYFPEEVAMNHLVLLTQQGNLTDARKLASVFRDVKSQRGEPSIKDLTGMLEKWMDFSEKPEGDARLLVGLAPSSKSKKQRVAWQIAPGNPPKSEANNRSYSPAFLNIPAAQQGTLKGSSLKLSVGESKDKMNVVQTISPKGLSGELEFQAPKNARYAKLSLLVDGKSISETEIPLLTTPNLLSNPEFKSDPATSLVPKWTNLLEPAVVRFTRGPFTGCTANTFLGDSGIQSIVGETIPIAPGKRYLFSCWVHQKIWGNNTRPSVRFLSAAGNQIGSGQIQEKSFIGWNWIYTYLTPKGGPQQEGATVEIPEIAVAFQVVLSPEQANFTKLAALSVNLVEEDVPAQTAATDTKKGKTKQP